MSEHPTYEHLDRLVDVDPIGLRDTAWTAIHGLRGEVERLTAELEQARAELAALHIAVEDEVAGT